MDNTLVHDIYLRRVSARRHPERTEADLRVIFNQLRDQAGKTMQWGEIEKIEIPKDKITNLTAYDAYCSTSVAFITYFNTQCRQEVVANKQTK